MLAQADKNKNQDKCSLPQYLCAFEMRPSKTTLYLLLKKFKIFEKKKVCQRKKKH